MINSSRNRSGYVSDCGVSQSSCRKHYHVVTSLSWRTWLDLWRNWVERL